MKGANNVPTKLPTPSPPKFVSLNDILTLIDSDEFYDLLPGNGEDDRICEWLEKRVKKLKTVELVKL